MPIVHLPPRWQPPLVRLRGVLMTDAGVMIILGVVMIIRGLSYLDLGQERLYHPADTLLTEPLSGILWGGIGLWLLVACWWPASTAARWALSAAVGLLSLWGMIFLLAPPAAFAQRGIIYLALSGVIAWAVWRGKRGEVRIREETAYDAHPRR